MNKLTFNRLAYANPPLWKIAYTNPVNASIFTVNEVLGIFRNGNLSAGNIVSAQRTSDLDFDLNKYRYLNVSIITSALDVVARIVIWTQPSLDHAYMLLLKTYNDKDWHMEIIDLSQFGIGGAGLFMIELGWIQVQDGYSSMIFYRQLSFGSLEVG